MGVISWGSGRHPISKIPAREIPTPNQGPLIFPLLSDGRKRVREHFRKYRNWTAWFSIFYWFRQGILKILASNAWAKHIGRLSAGLFLHTSHYYPTSLLNINCIGWFRLRVFVLAVRFHEAEHRYGGVLDQISQVYIIRDVWGLATRVNPVLLVLVVRPLRKTQGSWHKRPAGPTVKTGMRKLVKSVSTKPTKADPS